MTSNRLIAAGAFLVLITLPLMVQALRRGRLYQRGPHSRSDRHRQPIQFWSSIVASAAMTLLGAIMVAYGFLKS
jgi:hypothetical protein